MFAPARLCTSRVPARSSTVETIAAVVVLPLVAEITTLPRDSRPASRSIACGSTRVSTLPGQRRAAAAAGGAGEPADGARGRQPGGEPHRHGASTRSVPGTTSTVAGSSAIGSPSA